MMAMQSAFFGAATVDTCLRHPEMAGAALKKFDKSMRIGPKEFSWFIYRITNPTLRNMFMAPRNVFRVKEALLSVLAGDVYGNTPIHGGKNNCRWLQPQLSVSHVVIDRSMVRTKRWFPEKTVLTIFPCVFLGNTARSLHRRWSCHRLAV